MMVPDADGADDKLKFNWRLGNASGFKLSASVQSSRVTIRDGGITRQDAAPDSTHAAGKRSDRPDAADGLSRLIVDHQKHISW